jgi:hypothetical protein
LLSAAETDAAGQTKTELLGAEVEVKEDEVGVEKANFTICLTQLLYHQIDLSNLKIFQTNPITYTLHCLCQVFF